MKKKTPIKGVGLAEDVNTFASNISNFSGCVNALLRRLMHDKELQSELNKTHGIIFTSSNVVNTTISNKPKNQPMPVQNGWEVEV